MPVIELKIPNLGESISSVTFSKWLKPNGSIVKMDEPIAEIETEKANQELSAEAAGKLTWVTKEGEDLGVDAVYASIDTDASAQAATTPAKEEPKVAAATTTATATQTTTYATGHPSPAAAKILTEGSVASATVVGTGVDGRITKEDAQKAVEQKPAAVAAPAPTPVATTMLHSAATNVAKKCRVCVAP
jgi:2-oxoglutarate dehydrogenase E2 component (dihydrolipoamide succinyltransferase)